MNVKRVLDIEIAKRKLLQTKLMVWFDGQFFTDNLTPVLTDEKFADLSDSTIIYQLLLFFSKDSARNLELTVPSQKNLVFLTEFIPLFESTNQLDCKITYNLATNASFTLYEQHLNKIPLNLQQKIIAAQNAHFYGYKQIAPQNSFSETITAELMGNNAQFYLRELGMVASNLQISCNCVVKHLAQSCQSDLLYKTLLKEQSRTDFKAKVVVPREALETKAEVNNHNLLLDPTATAHTSPSLEVYADNVVCKHGATVGEFDPLALYYLRSRGLSEVNARQLLANAFGSEIMSQFPLWLTQNRPLPEF